MIFGWKTSTADARGQSVRAIAVAAWQATVLSGRIRLIRRTVALYRIRSSSARGGRVTMSVHVAPAVALRSRLRLRPEHSPLWHATSKLEGMRSVAAGGRSLLAARPVALTLPLRLRPEHQPPRLHAIARRVARSSR